MLDSLHQKSDLELYGDWRHTFRVIFIGVPLNWNHVLRHFKAQSLFFKGKKDRNYPCLFHSTMLITHKNTHESHLAHAWNLLYGKQSFFFSLSVPLQSLFQTPLETILTANPAVNFYLVWALIITSQFPFTSRSRGICFHSAADFFTPFLLLFFR